MMRKKMFFIYNPHAGKEQIRTKMYDILGVLAGSDYEVTVYPTKGYLDAVEKIQLLPDDYDLVVCSGGDGTLDEVVSGMMERKKRIPIGYIPAGTTNDFARSMKIPKNMVKAAEVAVHGVEFPCDIGSFNKGSFVYIAAFGVFTDVSYSTKQEVKNVIGHMAYVLEGMKRLYGIKSYHLKVTCEEMSFEDDFMFGMVTNSKSVGGFKSIIGKNVVFDDGVFEVTFIKKPKNPMELQEIMAAMLIEEIDTNYMYSFRTRKLTIEADTMIPWTLDGEFGGEHQTVEICNNQRAISIKVPEESLKAISMEETKEVRALECE